MPAVGRAAACAACQARMHTIATPGVPCGAAMAAPARPIRRSPGGAGLTGLLGLCPRGVDRRRGGGFVVRVALEPVLLPLHPLEHRLAPVVFRLLYAEVHRACAEQLHLRYQPVLAGPAIEGQEVLGQCPLQPSVRRLAPHLREPGWSLEGRVEVSSGDAIEPAAKLHLLPCPGLVVDTPDDKVEFEGEVRRRLREAHAIEHAPLVLEKGRDRPREVARLVAEEWPQVEQQDLPKAADRQHRHPLRSERPGVVREPRVQAEVPRLRPALEERGHLADVARPQNLELRDAAGRGQALHAGAPRGPGHRSDAEGHAGQRAGHKKPQQHREEA
mmetsp:Transcript_79908/g.231966  ORF Transcript_79908/g.231966 Transcript_79908/m.231966 type:complete len:330 (-) Transcript_79908:54-1043(-)